MMAEGAALVESMDWAAGSIIEDGSAEAAGAGDATVRAALELPGGGQQRSIFGYHPFCRSGSVSWRSSEFAAAQSSAALRYC